MSKACNHPNPGPLYWDWRCLNCSQPISEHARTFTRLWQWITGKEGSSNE